MAIRYLRYRDLHERGLVANRVTLDLWVRKHGFPTGRLVGPNTRLWTEDEIDEWLKKRPTGKKVEIWRKERAAAASSEETDPARKSAL